MKDEKVVKLPKRKKEKSKTGGVILIPLVLLVTTIIILLFSPIFNILHIEVKGVFNLTQNTVISDSKITIGTNILKLNKFEVKNNLYNNPYIKEASVHRKWPDTIVIDIVEKEPIAQIPFFGSQVLIDDEAIIIEVVTDGKEVKVPALTGVELTSFNLNKQIEMENQAELKKYLEILKELKNNDMLEKVEKITIKDSILIYFEEGHVAKLKDTSNLQYKIMLLSQILPRESNNVLIDLTNEEKPITKPLWGINLESSEGLEDS